MQNAQAQGREVSAVQYWLSLCMKDGSAYSTSAHPDFDEAHKFGKLWISVKGHQRKWKIMYEINGIGLEETSDSHVVTMTCPECTWTDTRIASVDYKTLERVTSKHKAYHEKPISKRYARTIAFIILALLALAILCSLKQG
jgi:hypothetical protein